MNYFLQLLIGDQELNNRSNGCRFKVDVAIELSSRLFEEGITINS